jgi:hypothetical protein
MEIRQTDQAAVALPVAGASSKQVRGTTKSDNEAGTTAATPSTIVQLSSSDQDGVRSATPDTDNNGSAQDTGDGKNPSAVKSFTYGVLGLSEPAAEDAEPEKPSNPYFTAGKLLAAAATVGTIISLVA